ncbi:MvaI/BcnI family restriction endonuclease [Zunongwangia sp. HRR-M8]|uniref:MvaI/BcnI family restriction endonuclease n=1 Tax=Zunongwangia sp. HRR-M8 TaxID=3015170 RepID=UPI0022DDBE8E|nr:MvaI/BcnI family restriction endonuclease [Zunongwangia sp. HRR-M8]WBL22314.1 MvaI/BcnI family restriction endonuclease [Zunongwangia sp. HRR-M8]
MRKLTPAEERRLKVFTENSIPVTLIEPTTTGLKKSIMDATGPVRNYLKERGCHDFTCQGQGTQNKVLVKSILYSGFSTKNTRTSLYRPSTKKGDPRIWVYGLTAYADPNDILALVYFEGTMHAINISRLPLEKLVNSPVTNPLKELVSEISSKENRVPNELLGLIRNISGRGFIPSNLNADTAVGRLLETLLGIDINSSKQPDYKGIELKSFRSNKGNRKNLFAQVPNWELSKFKSSGEILDAFGYWRDEDFKLYCTVSTLVENSQGLFLKTDLEKEKLIESSSNHLVNDFAVWELSKLHERLLEKHRETFWVSAESKVINGVEHFQYSAVEHTRKPIVSQFDILLDQGKITLDHLIKRDRRGKTREKGPLFKIKPNALNLLFPPSKKYDLLQE